MRSIEISYEGSIHPEVVTYLTKDLGLLVQQTRPLIVRSANVNRDAESVLSAVRLIPGVKRILVRAGSESDALLACEAGI